MGVGHFVLPPSPEETLKTLGGIGLILRILELFVLEVCKFRKKLANLTYSIVSECFTYLTCTYLKTEKVFSYEIFGILFSCKDKDIGRFSNLHWCTFKDTKS